MNPRAPLKQAKARTSPDRTGQTEAEGVLENSSHRSRRVRTGFLNPAEMALAIFTVSLAVVLSLYRPTSFATTSNVHNMLTQGSVLGLVVLGQIFPLIVGGFDISVGAMMGVSSVATVLTMKSYGILPGLIAGIVFAGLLGAVNGVLVGKLMLTPFIVTLGMLSIARGISLITTRGTPITSPPDGLRWFGARDWGVFPSSFCIFLLVLLIIVLILKYTKIGLHFYAVGSNEAAARLAGVPVDRIKLIAYSLSAVSAGIAGIVLSAQVFSGQPSLGDGYELESIATAVIGGVAIGGGRGRLRGVALGIIFMTIVSSGLNIADVSPFVQRTVVGILIILAILWDRIQTRTGLARSKA